MDLGTIKSVLKDHRVIVLRCMSDPKIITRDAKIPENVFAIPNILAILGVRRSGKSTLAIQIIREKKFLYVNFDDERLYGMRANQLNMILEAYIEENGSEPDYIVLDEIQNIEGWELFATRLRNSYRVVITGSNANLLWGELATHLTGRHLDVYLMPFSFAEYLRFKAIEVDVYSTKGSSICRRELETYLVSGGFPETHIVSDSVISQIYKDIIIKDAILRYKIRNRKVFNDIARYLISHHSREFTYSRLARIHDLTNQGKAKTFVEKMVDVNLIFVIDRYSRKMSVQTKSPKKVYCIDNGFITKIGFGISDDFGLKMENLVAIELKRDIENSKHIDELYYWKNDNSEVDFLIRKGIKFEELIQVCKTVEDKSTLEREISGLIQASEDVACDKLMIITWNERGQIKKDGKMINIIPLYEWLLKR
jgi:predicted AAA+ superfamily ATPase